MALTTSLSVEVSVHSSTAVYTHHFSLQFLYFFGELLCLTLDLLNGGLDEEGEGGNRQEGEEIGH